MVVGGLTMPSVVLLIHSFVLLVIKNGNIVLLILSVKPIPPSVRKESLQLCLDSLWSWLIFTGMFLIEKVKDS